MRLRADRIKVQVPATTVDFGSTSGSLAMALARTDSVTIRAVAGESQVRMIDADARIVPERWLEPAEVDRHLTVRALRHVLNYAGAPEVGVHLTYRRGIPEDTGLGDREAKVLAGVYGAWALLGKPQVFDERAMVSMAEQFGASTGRSRGAIEGGLVLALPDATGVGNDYEKAETIPGRPSRGGDSSLTLSFETSPFVSPVALVPSGATTGGQRVGDLAQDVEMRRHLRATARAAALVPLLSGEPRAYGSNDGDETLWRTLLVAATDDDGAQTRRVNDVPASLALIAWLRERGQAAFLSGSGPTVMCLWQLPDDLAAAVERSGWRAIATPVAMDGLLLDV